MSNVLDLTPISSASMVCRFPHYLGALVVLALASCDPADVREMEISAPGGEQQMRRFVGEVNQIALSHGFSRDEANEALQRAGIVAEWRRKLHPSDPATRIGCYIFFDKTANSGRVRLVLFPGTHLPPDSIVMFDELKKLCERAHISAFATH
jgi:hypothetical protein